MTNGGMIGRDNRPSVYSAAGVWNVNEAYHARLSDNWPGEVLTQAGSFTKINTTGTQAVTGLGFKPKAVIFFAAGSDLSSGTWDSHIAQIIGFATATENYSVSSVSEDNVASSNASRRMAAKAITRPTASGSATFYEADLSSMDTDGFTLNWTTNTTESTTICYMALGGNIQAKAVSWTTPTVTGDKVVTGVGFEPDLVFHTSAPTTTIPQTAGSAAQHVFGAMNNAGEQWVTCGSSDDNVAARTDRYQRTNKCFAWTYRDVVEEEATYVSMDSDGFTTNFGTANTGAYYTVSLCLKGVRSKLGSFNKPTGTAPQPQSITAPGFKPKIVMAVSDSLATSTIVNARSTFSLGAYDGTNSRTIAMVDEDAASPNTQADSIWALGKLLYTTSVSGTSPQANSGATPNSLDATGWTHTWDPNNASAYEILYAAIGTP